MVKRWPDRIQGKFNVNGKWVYNLKGYKIDILRVEI